MGIPGHLCVEPGCTVLAVRGRKACREHAHDGYAKRGTDKQRGYGKAHRNRRKRLLAMQPLCVACGEAGHTRAATIADHIVPLAQGGAETMANLQPLCKECHDRKTVLEDGGFKHNRPRPDFKIKQEPGVRVLRW